MIGMPCYRRSVSSSRAKLPHGSLVHYNVKLFELRGSKRDNGTLREDAPGGRVAVERRRERERERERIEGEPKVIGGRDAFTSHRVTECNELLFAEQCR